MSFLSSIFCNSSKNEFVARRLIYLIFFYLHQLSKIESVTICLMRYYFFSESDHGLLKAPPPPPVVIPPIKTKDINTAAKNADVKRVGRVSLERDLRRLGIKTRKRGPESVHRHLQRSNHRSRKLSKQATKVIDTSVNLVEG